MKSGANPNAIDYRGFTPLHELMDKVFPAGVGYNEEIVIRGGDSFEYHSTIDAGDSSNCPKIRGMCKCIYK